MNNLNHKLAEALRLFLKSAYPVCTTIDARGYRWRDESLADARDAAYKALAAHAAEQAQEPVAEVVLANEIDGEGSPTHLHDLDYFQSVVDKLPAGTKLYAAPVEQAAQAVPAGWRLWVTESETESVLNIEHACAGGMSFIAERGSVRAQLMQQLAADLAAAPAPEAQQWNERCPGDSGRECELPSLCSRKGFCMRTDAELPAAPAPEAAK